MTRRTAPTASRGGRRGASALVLVDVTSAERRRLTRSGRVTFCSTDPRSGRVAFEREGRAGYIIIDLATFGRTTVAAGDLPHLNGDTTLL